MILPFGLRFLVIFIDLSLNGRSPADDYLTIFQSILWNGQLLGCHPDEEDADVD